MSRHNRPINRYANGHRRRQLRLQVLAEEDTCWICNKPVDVTLPHGKADSPEVDEVVPVSKGGSPYLRSNCRLSHRLCNQRRGNGQRRGRHPVIEPFFTARTWTA